MTYRLDSQAITSDPATTDQFGHDGPTPDAVLIVDANARMILMNHRAEVLFGYTARDLLNQPLNLLLPEQIHEVHDALVAQYMERPRARPMGAGVRALGRCHDGRILQLEISLSPLLGAGPLYVLCMIRDVTERRDNEQVKEDFVTIAAHALHTPLTALRGYVDTLQIRTRSGKGAPLDEWQLEVIEEIQWATERLESLSAALLDVTRIQTGQLEVRRELHDLVALVWRVVARVRRSAQTHTIIVQAPPQSLVASIDARLIEQTLDHLLDNAMKYSPRGEKIEITVRHRAALHDVIIQVRDHGVGIPKEQRERIFTRFGGHDNPAGIAGTGLSLYLCRQFVERHGGHIGVRVTRGQGATVWFSLPLGLDITAY
jgi:PAS domain S-box-containing protein